MFSAQRSLDLVESKMSLNCGGSLLGARYDTGLELVLLQGARYGTVIYWEQSNGQEWYWNFSESSMVLEYASGTDTLLYGTDCFIWEQCNGWTLDNKKSLSTKII